MLKTKSNKVTVLDLKYMKINLLQYLKKVGLQYLQVVVIHNGVI
ncbi:hypothetical protein [Staphylococcus phage vB_ScaM-V1SC04]|nr:hypothetical protein [Staphylococcus phage vB_ScaM-V1SC04]